MNNAVNPNFIARLKAPIPPLAGIIIPKVPTTKIKHPSAGVKFEVSGRAKQTRYEAKK